MISKPSAGRIVHYVLGDGDAGGDTTGQHRPAIVLFSAEEKGWDCPPEGQVCQLIVFLDGHNDSRSSAHTLWATSIKRDETNKVPGTWHEPEVV